MTISIVLIEDHKLMLQGLKSLLNEQPEFKIVGEAEDGPEGLKLVKELKPEVVILDVMLPSMSGIDVAREISGLNYGTKIVAISAYSNRHFVLELLKSGAAAYLLKQDALESLVQAIHAAMQGESIYLSARIKQLVVDNFANRYASGGVAPPSQLSEREFQILQYMLQGKSSKEIAAEADLSLQTISGYRTQIMKKLGVQNVVELVKYALKEGLIPFD